MNIQGIKSGLSTEVDILPVAITPPTAARVHGIASASPEDTGSAVQQVETATVVGTITGDGNATVIVTSAGMTGSPKTVNVAVLTDDTAEDVATKIAAALTADAAIGHATTGKFTVTSDGADVILTANDAAANDATLNVDINNGTCTGLTDAPTSVATTAGSLATGSNKVMVEGVDADYNFVSEVVYLNGTGSVNTSNSYWFINSMYSFDCPVNVGVITATAATDSTTSCTISAGAGESQQAYFMAYEDIVLEDLYLSVVNATATAVTTFKVKVKEKFGGWRTKRVFSFIGSDTYNALPLDIFIKKRSLVKLTAVASAATSTVSVFLKTK